MVGDGDNLIESAGIIPKLGSLETKRHAESDVVTRERSNFGSNLDCVGGNLVL